MHQFKGKVSFEIPLMLFPITPDSVMFWDFEISVTLDYHDNNSRACYESLTKLQLPRLIFSNPDALRLSKNQKSWLFQKWSLFNGLWNALSLGKGRNLFWYNLFFYLIAKKGTPPLRFVISPVTKVQPK